MMMMSGITTHHLSCFQVVKIGRVSVRQSGRKLSSFKSQIIKISQLGNEGSACAQVTATSTRIHSDFDKVSMSLVDVASKVKKKPRCETAVSKTELDSYGKFRAYVLAALHCVNGDMIQDIKYRLWTGDSRHSLASEADFDTMWLQAIPNREKTKKKQVTILIDSAVAEEQFKESQARVGLYKNVPEALLSGDPKENDLAARLYRHYAEERKCAKCPPGTLCLVGYDGRHEVTPLQISTWANSLLRGEPDVTIKAPPKVKIFSSYWGPSIKLLDGEHPNKQQPVPPKKAAAPTGSSDLITFTSAITAALAAVGDLQRVNQPIQQDRIIAEMEDFVAENHRLFPQVIDFFKGLHDDEKDDPNPRDWIKFADCFVAAGSTTVGDLFGWRNEQELIEKIGMPIGMARALIPKVRAACNRILREHRARDS
ncbi:hypothetical protein BKA62DRAFT_773019 [Auriculariales sp. MPI-PUGE-AT-0066]|nr:hypothetical protein BKA62DRAFT_773019 [Auriculariales sp. MPI-PUGE-AT-0066]